ncbi:DUF2804 domain-containing protein [Candidatus Nanopelagicales bacterium]|nr:DUF2804 domain-containing protein [Candidatus Nanopelagicales bacterium]
MRAASNRIHSLAMPKVPDAVVDNQGHPRFGVYRGVPEEIDLSGLGHPYSRNRLGEFLRHKRWMYIFATTDEIQIAAAIVDAGPTGTAFLSVTDRATGEKLAEASRPGGTRPLVRVGNKPAAGHRSHYVLPGTMMTARADERDLRFQASFHRVPFLPMLSDPWIDLDLWMELDAHDGITAVSEIAGSSPMVTTTVKNAALPVRGQLTLNRDGRKTEFSLAAGQGGFDFTSGYLPRETSWRWAFSVGRSADNRSVGLNLTSDFSGMGGRCGENMIWLDGVPHRLNPSADISFDQTEPLKPWHITTSDGAVDLIFNPMSVHKESLNLGAVRSSFIQPAGHFSGSVRVGDERVVLDALPGVVEDQDILW